jgi:hypothetical protein
MKEEINIQEAERLVVIGNEGALKVTAKPTFRGWLRGGRLGGPMSWQDHISLGAHSFTAKGRYLQDGGYTDPLDGKRVLFYCRILPDDAREELAAHDTRIADLHTRLVAAQRERQDFLAGCARRGARVPTPPQPPKPMGEP